MQKYTLLFFCILCATYSYAFDTIPKIYLLHINGINTTHREAIKNLLNLKTTIHPDSNMISWDLVWNPTGEDAGETTFDNILDVLQQKLGENNVNMSFDEFINYYLSQYPEKYPKKQYSPGSDSYTSFQKSVLDDYAKMIKANSGSNFPYILDEFHKLIPAQFAAVLQLLQQNNSGNNYKSSNAYVILIPHSQGNLYANALYTYLTNVEHFNPLHIQIFGIATPVKKLDGNQILHEINLECNNLKHVFTCPTYEYLTSTSDKVIASLRFLGDALATKGNDSFTVLPSNIKIDTPITSLGHSLINTYLNNSNSRNKIGESINNLITFFTIALMNPDSDRQDINPSIPKMRVEMQGSNNHKLIDTTTNTVVCEHGTCPASDGYIMINIRGKPIGEYFFSRQNGFMTEFDPNQSKGLMHINCKTKKLECRLWQDNTCNNK